MSWQTQRLCSDVGEYVLIVERQKRSWECEQRMESWKWSIVYHGTIVASGSVNNVEEAKKMAEGNVPHG